MQRVAVLVSDEDDVPEGAAAESGPLSSSERSADEVNAETAGEPAPASSGEGWPRDLGKGQYELSDGSQVYGKNKAQAAQDALDEEEDGA